MTPATFPNLDSFFPFLSSTDTKMKLSVGGKLYTYLGDTSNSIECSDIGYVIDTLGLWLQNSNFKVVQLGLEILVELVERMRSDFQTYISSVLPHMLDKLGDSKEVIRSKTSFLLMKFVECNAISLQCLLDKVTPTAFQHKNSHVREQILIFITTAIDENGTSSICISKMLPGIVKLLSDPNVSVRMAAFNTLVVIYKHVGEKLKADLQKKYSVPQNKLPALLHAFDEVKLVSKTNALTLSCIDGIESMPEENKYNSNFPMCFDLPPITPPNSITSSLSKMSKVTTTAATRSKIGHNSNNANHHSGTVDEDSFLNTFESVPAVHIYSGKDVEEIMKKTNDIIGNVDQDWNKRIEGLRTIRSLVVAGGLEYEEFYNNINLLLPAFHTSVKDLRSQVVRETCITLAYLSTKLRVKFDHFAESVLNDLISLIQNSAKVIASSGLVAVKFLLRYTHSSRLILPVANCMDSKSKEIRRACCEFMYLMLKTWSTQVLEKHASALQHALKKGITDADSEARMYSRKAFGIFSKHFPEHADSLLSTLDPSYRKILSEDSTTTTKASVSSDEFPKYKCSSRFRSNSVKNGFPVFSSRSNSAIDLHSARRAKVRAQYADFSRQKVGGGNNNAKSKRSTLTKNSYSSCERSGRSKDRISVSQPTSRSGSPSSVCSEHSVHQKRDYELTEMKVQSITEIITHCESIRWSDRKEGLIGLQHYIDSGNQISLADLKKLTDILVKIFNDPHTKIFSLFLDALNKLILSHHHMIHSNLHLLMTRLFNKLGTDLLTSVHTKILKTLDVVFTSFPPDLQLLSVFRFLVDPIQTPNARVKLSALNYILRLVKTEEISLSLLDSCNSDDSIDGGGTHYREKNKSITLRVLEKIIQCTIKDSPKQETELRRVAEECLVALFCLDIPYVTKLFSELPSEYQVAANVIKKSCRKNSNNNSSEVDSVEPSSFEFSETGPLSFTSESDLLKRNLDAVSQSSEYNVEVRRKLMLEIDQIIQNGSTDIIFSNFKTLLRLILSLISDADSPELKEVALTLLQTMIKRRNITHCFNDYIELVILKIMGASRDANKDVAKASESCSIMLCSYLPSDLVVRVIIPLIQTGDFPMNLLAIKMLTRIVECGDKSAVADRIGDIMCSLLTAYDNPDSSVRKSTVFCIVAIHKQLGEEMVSPYISTLNGAKLKLLQLYIKRSYNSFSLSTTKNI